MPPFPSFSKVARAVLCSAVLVVLAACAAAPSSPGARPPAPGTELQGIVLGNPDRVGLEKIRTVVQFYELGLNQKNADAAIVLLGDRYVQHNPNAADGPDGFRQFIAFLKTRFPQSHSTIKKAFVDGDYVILHVHAVREPGQAGNAIVDIFKLENGKIVEHWDAVQPIPEKSANGNTMF